MSPNLSIPRRLVPADDLRPSDAPAVPRTGSGDTSAGHCSSPLSSRIADPRHASDGGRVLHGGTGAQTSQAFARQASAGDSKEDQ